MAKSDMKKQGDAASANTSSVFDASSILTADTEQQRNLEDEELPPPAYSEHYGTIEDGEGAQGTGATVTGLRRLSATTANFG